MPEQTIVTKLFCLAGLHNWYEPTMDFFNPMNVKEECLNCKTTRVRFDKRRKVPVWQKRKRWF